MFKSFLIFFTISLCHNSNAYPQNTPLKNIKIIEQFDSDGTVIKFANGKTEYEYRERKWSNRKYKKYFGSRENVWDCHPCILKTYSVKRKILLEEKLVYTACDIGYIKKYYSNGNLKYSGQYYQDTTITEDSLYYLHKCAIPDGDWTYYDEKRNELYIEKWNKGKFIEQIPKQNKCEIWDVLVLLPFSTDSILNLEDIKLLEFKPLFKNVNKSMINLKYKVTIGRGSIGTVLGSYTPSELKEQDFRSKLPKRITNFNDSKYIFISFTAFSNGEAVKTMRFELKG